MKKDPIQHVLEYFSFFSYPPTFDEIHTFISKKISKKDLRNILEKSVKNGDLRAQGKPDTRYTFSTKFNFFDLFTGRAAVSSRKIEKVAGYLKLINNLPYLLLTGISGSVSMKNAKETDDIDIFIITIPNRLWTARFWVITLAYILGIKRNRGDKHVSDKVCLNLFFDGKNVKIPDHKRTEYVAHELLQMKPLLNRNSIYEHLLNENLWVKDYFPNVILPHKNDIPLKKVSLIGNLLESLFRRIQLTIMRPHQTKEFISDTQLWFYPKDFEKVVEKNKLTKMMGQRA